jgi:taurine--2-oxoglutarate transaminase
MKEGTDKKMTGDELVKMSREHVFFSWSVQKDVAPIPIESGKGIYYWDLDGKKYMDFSAQLMSLNIGYQHPKVVAAIQEQAAKLTVAHPSATHEPKAILGKMISEITPGDLNKVFYTLGGADANENMIKFARFFTGRHKFIARYISYHGATFGAVALSGDYRRPPVEPAMPGVVHILDPYCYRCPFGHSIDTCHRECIKHVEDVIGFENPETVAAVVMEGVTGSNGIIIPPDDYLPRIREITKKYGILLVSDEVMSGFGRTGEWFAINNWNVVPDMITMAKGLTSGYLPLGAVVVSDAIAKFLEDKYLYAGLTYCGHPMCCAAGIATLNVYKEEKIFENVKKLGKVLGDQLEQIKLRHKSVGDVRYIGLFSVIELVKDRTTKERMDLATMGAIRNQLQAEGLTTFVTKNMILVAPPLIITQNELLDGLKIIEKSIEIADKKV